jgi:hypothetical protein
MSGWQGMARDGKPNSEAYPSYQVEGANDDEEDQAE